MPDIISLSSNLHFSIDGESVRVFQTAKPDIRSREMFSAQVTVKELSRVMDMLPSGKPVAVKPKSVSEPKPAADLKPATKKKPAADKADK